MKLNFEQRSGMSFDDVRVHYNSDKPAQFHALAYTRGTQIYIGPGQERSLPHELGHVIQQKAGLVRPTRWVCGQPVNDQLELEREADRSPVQYMTASALRDVIQMDWRSMPRQRGANCGYHALARAMYALTDKIGDPYNEKNVEMQLTSFAIKKGYSVIGEAFDPYTLAYVGNEFCIANGIELCCTVVTIRNEEDLQKILDKSEGNSMILVPYFRMGDFSPGIRPRQSQGAHWSVIEADGTSYKLYEGNVYGSTPIGDAKEGNRGGQNALDLGNDAIGKLFTSNKSLSPEFNWKTYLETLSPYSEKALERLNAKRQPFLDGESSTDVQEEKNMRIIDNTTMDDFYDRTETVRSNISRINKHREELKNKLSKGIIPPTLIASDRNIQNSSLAHHVVRVERKEPIKLQMDPPATV